MSHHTPSSRPDGSTRRPIFYFFITRRTLRQGESVDSIGSHTRPRSICSQMIFCVCGSQTRFMPSHSLDGPDSSSAVDISLDDLLRNSVQRLVSLHSNFSYAVSLSLGLKSMYLYRSWDNRFAQHQISGRRSGRGVSDPDRVGEIEVLLLQSRSC
ncbi:hypothetical protein QCA50_016406 [Cerrena zonata]|uniref:Uncharacterized protein n=1 Tax=Cerrena zonata TaxID=2478898 RepID=A0AAW0FM66_9APHY